MTLSLPETGLHASLRRDFRDLRIELQDVQRKEIDGVSIVIARGSITRGSSDGDTTSVHTLAHHEAPGARIPRFELRPMRARAIGFGMHGLKFDEQPEFSKQYFVWATEPLRVPAILHRKVRDWLLAHPATSFEAGGQGVIVFHPDGLVHGGDVDAFAREAAELAGLLAQAGRFNAATPQPSEMEEARAFAAQLPAFMARSYEKQLEASRVTRANVDTFLRQTPPRNIPGNIARLYQMCFTISGFGLAFFLGGAVFVSAGMYTARWEAIAIGTLACLVGGTMVYFALPRFRRERRLLRWGQPALAEILGVKPTGGAENGQDIYEVQANYELDGRRVPVQCRAAGGGAKRVAAEGRPARILYDPARPEHILLVDALVNSHEE